MSNEVKVVVFEKPADQFALEKVIFESMDHQTASADVLLEQLKRVIEAGIQPPLEMKSIFEFEMERNSERGEGAARKSSNRCAQKYKHEFIEDEPVGSDGKASYTCRACRKQLKHVTEDACRKHLQNKHRGFSFSGFGEFWQ